MKAPLSWLKDFVDIDLSLPDLTRLITMAGMEVESLYILGLPIPQPGSVDVPVTGLAWDREKIVVASILEVMPHPNADRLVLCRLNDGVQEHVVLTGAPNLFDYKGAGPLEKPLMVAYAREGAQIYDGHQEGQVLTTLKRAKIRGVESYSMVCSEKELGISEEHEGIMFLDADAQAGLPLADLMGDAVLDVKLLPSYARCASMLGLAREIAAMTGKTLKPPQFSGGEAGTAGGDFAAIEIKDAALNPRFVLGLLEGIEIRPSPAWVQRRLKLAGMRPINNIVDATNYVMLEIGEPLHAFDHDVLKKRARGRKVQIITRPAAQGEKLTTLDGVERTLDGSTVLVCDQTGALSIAGVMGGMESEISPATTNILLEGAAWNFINIRKTARGQMLPSEAAYRFGRGVHPSLAKWGVLRGLELMQAWAGGKMAPGLVDSYPLSRIDPVNVLSSADVERWLGIRLPTAEIMRLLQALDFQCTLIPASQEGEGDGTMESIRVLTPDHRLDIGDGITGKADLIEEVARVYGYENIPETRMADLLPLQLGNPELDKEERLRDLLVYQGLTEIVSYRWTTPEREGRRLPEDVPADDKPYLRIANPLAYEKGFMRHSVLASVLDAVERNARVRERLALFEIGPVFLPSEGGDLPDEPHHLAIALAGARSLPGWQPADGEAMDFYDLKGILVTLFEGLRLWETGFEPGTHPSFHPGKCARVTCGGQPLGVLGELHPNVRLRYDLPAAFKAPILAAEIDLDRLLALVPDLRQTAPVPTLPPVLEDLAVVVEENIPAGKVQDLILQAGGKLVSEVRLFDVYRGGSLGDGMKSLAFRLTFQSQDKTLTDKDVAGVRGRILKRLEQEINARLRG
jgi:phenylalanyl-tRNA synthetase beta chain